MPTKCKNCGQIKEGRVKKCFGCKKSGCDKCIPVGCCDCSERICGDCEGESNCGCYGTCSKCGAEVNRGENGWPCIKCKRWYCDEECSKSSRCKACK